MPSFCKSFVALVDKKSPIYYNPSIPFQEGVEHLEFTGWYWKTPFRQAGTSVLLFSLSVHFRSEYTDSDGLG